jgi:DtxR family Mn-dependent transcriptional regulator
MELSITEEIYLKAILKLSAGPETTVSTNAIAAQVHTSAASVTDMLKRLAEKELITYQRYQGARLTEQGIRIATYLLRKHRLWKVFLVQKLGMSWDVVHDIAGELEHIRSTSLIDQLDSFLGFPKFDPHGDPIPNAQGKYTLRAQLPLTELQPGKSGFVIGVRESENSFLKYLSEKGITLGKTISVIANESYDQTMIFSIDGVEASISGKVAQNVLVKVI